MKASLPTYSLKSLTYGTQDAWICRLSSYLQRHPFLSFPHKHDFYQLLYMYQGGGTLSIEHEIFELKSTQVYFSVPGQVQKLQCEPGAKGFIINFSMPYFKAFLLNPNYVEQFPCFSGLIENSVIDIPQHLQGDVHKLLETIITEIENNHNGSTDMVRLLMLQLFIQVGRLTHYQSPTTRIVSYKYTQVKNLLTLLEQHITSAKLPKEYAQLLFVTPNYLNTLCNEVLGKSTGEVIRERVVLEAKRLIANGSFTISEIGYKLDFKDNSYFTKFFKKYTGQTPQQFRMEYAQKKGPKQVEEASLSPAIAS
jgi:AraC-like DNA-binding protein